MFLARTLQVLFIATPLVFWCANALLGKRRIRWPYLFVLAGLGGYALLLVAVQALEHALLEDLYTHDLDGNRSFSDSELTEEAQRAMNRVTNDTGRTLAPITGIPIIFTWTLINFAVLGTIESTGRWLLSRFVQLKTRHDGTMPESIAPDQTGMLNPYHPPASLSASPEPTMPEHRGR